MQSDTKTHSAHAGRTRSTSAPVRTRQRLPGRKARRPRPLRPARHPSSKVMTTTSLRALWGVTTGLSACWMVPSAATTLKRVSSVFHCVPQHRSCPCQLHRELLTPLNDTGWPQCASSPVTSFNRAQGEPSWWLRGGLQRLQSTCGGPNTV
jgi:hypothetical protein